MTSVQVNIDKEMMSMIKCFRVIDLQELLGYAGRNKNGRKSDLVDRAMQMIKTTGSNKKIQIKVVELYRRRYPLQTTVKPSALLHSSGALPNDWAYYQGENVQPNSHDSHHLNGIKVGINMKPLPFYENLSEILAPIRLESKSSHCNQESVSHFSLKQHQLSKFLAVKHCIQIQLRFCEFDTSTEQGDKLPPELRVRINSSFVPLPPYIPPTKAGDPPKQQHRPIDVTSICRNIGLSKNYVLTVRWSTPPRKDYATCINLVRQLTVAELLEKLEQRGPQESFVSQALIKEKLSRDLESDILTTSLKVSLLCPLGKMRMTLPTRPAECRHLQCFDAALFLKMNEKKPTWICPVCDKPAEFRSLRIDGLFTEILKSTESDEIEFTEDGNWHCANGKTKTNINSSNPIDLSSTNQKLSEVDKISKNVDVIDLTEDSTDDEEPPKPPSKSPIRASSNTPVSTSSSPLDLGMNKQKNGVHEPPLSSSHFNSYRKSPHTKSYLSPATSPYCKSDSPLFKTRQPPAQPNPPKPFDLSSRHTPLKQTPQPSRFSPFSYNGSKESTPNLQIPSPYVSGTPPSINGIFPQFSNLDFGLDRYSPSLNFGPLHDPNLLLRYPHPPSLDLLNSRYLLNSMAGAGAISPYLMPQFPMLNPYDLSSLPQSSSVNAPNSRSNELRLNTPRLDLTDDLSFNAETVD